MTLTYDHLQFENMPELTRRSALGIFACVAILFVGGQLLLPYWLVGIVPMALLIGIGMLRSGLVAFYCFITVIFALGFRVATSAAVDLSDLLAAACIGGIEIAWAFRLWVIQREQVSQELPHTFFHIFLGWAVLLGLTGVLLAGNSATLFLREFTVYGQLLVLPILYVRFIGTNTRRQRILFRYLLFIAIATILWGGLRYSGNIAAAAYAYQINRMVMNTSMPTVFILAFVAISLFKLPWMKVYWRLALSVFCLGAILVASYRTTWVALALAIVILIAVSNQSDRKAGFAFLTKFGLILTGVGTYFFFKIPLFKIFLLMQFGRFLSTAEVTTDPSLFSRYIEYEALWSYFLKSPVVGYGLGAEFQIFDWLEGFTRDYSYSHNGYLYVVIKTGIIGFILLYSAYVGFIVKAFRLARDVQHKPEVRAIAAVCVSFLAVQLIVNSTLNIFADRSLLLWIGLMWGFLLSYKVHKKEPAVEQEAIEQKRIEQERSVALVQ